MTDLAQLTEEGLPGSATRLHILIELDYGGLVQLLSDDALSSDQSAAEIAAAIDGVTKGERELAVAMYKRAQNRWRAFAEYEMAN